MARVAAPASRFRRRAVGFQGYLPVRRTVRMRHASPHSVGAQSAGACAPAWGPGQNCLAEPRPAWSHIASTLILHVRHGMHLPLGLASADGCTIGNAVDMRRWRMCAAGARS